MKTSDIHIRDPYILPLPDEGRYLLFGTTGKNAWSGLGLGFDCYESRELGEPSGHDDFLFAKTTLQTNSDYDPRLAIAVDSVIVHRHGAEEKILARAIGSWYERGYAVGRMFFADSDATNEYWTGKWDGTPHPDEVERDARGEAVLCSGIRPYMLPTAGWTRYLQEMAVASVRAGAEAIFPEEPLWWVRQGMRDPLVHLFGEMGLEDNGEFDQPVGKGHVYRRLAGGRRFADPEAAQAEYLPLLDAAVRQTGGADGVRRPGHFCMKRGPFVVAHAIRQPLRLAGPLVDVFDPEFPVLDGVELQPGESGLYREVGELVASAVGRGQPVLLHATHRLMSDTYADGVSRAVIRGPAETPAVVRFHAAGRELQGAEAVDTEGKDLAVERRQDGASLLVCFPNVPEGATLTIRWKGRPT